MSVEITDLGLDGVRVVTGQFFHDNRGYFLETWNKDAYASRGLDIQYVQDNESLSKRRGTLRGLHYQRAPFAQAKLVRVVMGAILDVFVDIRAGSATRGKWVSIELRASEGKQVYIPRGFAHGFVTLTDDCVVNYKVDAPYSQAHDTGIRWDDPELGIKWPFHASELTISDKDRALPLFKDCIP